MLHDLDRLAQCAADGDRAAWNTLVDSYVAPAWRTALGAGLDVEQAAGALELAWLRTSQALAAASPATGYPSPGGLLMSTLMDESSAAERHSRAPTWPYLEV
ncbi:MAG: hypothetical protein JWN35_2510 [Frankiales bacterium]|jgi:hypothetical protein|nr:hypothetical protein [Frankiales bacterium]